MMVRSRGSSAGQQMAHSLVLSRQSKAESTRSFFVAMNHVLQWTVNLFQLPLFSLRTTQVLQAIFRPPDLQPPSQTVNVSLERLDVSPNKKGWMRKPVATDRWRSSRLRRFHLLADPTWLASFRKGARISHPRAHSSSEEEAEDVYMIFLAQPPLAFSNNKGVLRSYPPRSHSSVTRTAPLGWGCYDFRPSSRSR